MKKLVHPLFLLFLFVSFLGCSDNSATGPDPKPEPSPEEASSEKQFVWNAMNGWYLYQADVADLGDDRFSSEQAYHDFLMGYSDAETLFGDLQIQNDPYSFFIDDYEEYEREQDGIYAALGFNYGYILLNDNTTIIGYVQYVVPNSPADDAGLERGDLFTEVDGTSLNINNYQGILRDNGSHTLTMAEIQDNTIVETGETITVESEQVQEDPILLSTVIDTSGTQIGYLMYNAFQGNSHEDLNQVFGDFQAQGVDELVLDLRYNGGGAVITSQTMASMISGLGTSQTFAKFTYNEKKSQYNNTDSFLDAVPLQNNEGDFEQNNEGEYVNTIPMNTLSLNKLYVLTSQATASASEALINGLEPFIDVVIIGTQTEGKDVGSITLYDAPPEYTNKDNINPNHKKAIQPIVVAIRNAEDARYNSGFKPDYEVSEINMLGNLPPIGSPQDPLFSEAISQITGTQRAIQGAVQEKQPDILRNSRLLMIPSQLQSPRNHMYIETHMMPSESLK